MSRLIFLLLVALAVYQCTSALSKKKPPKKTCRLVVPRYHCIAKKCVISRKCFFGKFQGGFKTKALCKAKCGSGGTRSVCSLPKQTGPCKARLRRFYHDKKSGKCKVFTYGGCRGNGNNFKTLGACAKKCKTKRGSRSVCFLPKQTGPCRASFRRFYHDKKSGQCKLFIYGGCRGNGNNFRTLSACAKKCKTKGGTRSVCSLPKQTGPCRARLRRFYHDKKSGKCKVFTYGGCRGNGNNFKTLGACAKKCKTKRGTRSVCSLPKQTGPCRASFKRFYHDKKSGRCKIFIYGGCRGNGNNFKTLRACVKKCKKMEDDLTTIMDDLNEPAVEEEDDYDY